MSDRALEVFRDADDLIASVREWTEGIYELAASDFVLERRDELLHLANELDRVLEIAAELAGKPNMQAALADVAHRQSNELRVELDRFRWLLASEDL